jgi:hypothetical protein
MSRRAGAVWQLDQSGPAVIAQGGQVGIRDAGVFALLAIGDTAAGADQVVPAAGRQRAGDVLRGRRGEVAGDDGVVEDDSARGVVNPAA